MSAETVGSVILWLIVLAIVVVIAVYLLRWLYRRSTKEIAFVRTGFGGEKVIISGGAFVVPVLHEITPVGMNVMRIEVVRRQAQGLITKEELRSIAFQAAAELELGQWRIIENLRAFA